MQSQVPRIPGDFSTCSQGFDAIWCCVVDFQRLHLLKQYRPVLSPGLPGSWFHDGSDHTTSPQFLTDFAAINSMSRKCSLRLPFQISVQEEALTSAPEAFSYISVQEDDIKFILDDIELGLLIAHCAEGSPPTWRSQTELS